MIPAAFDYHRPRSLADAIKLLGDTPDARPLAGGHSLIPMMKLRLAAPPALVDLAAIDELRGIARDGGSIVIGATTTQHEVIASPLLAETLPILAETARQVADPQVRYLGTLGGNVANGDPGNDMPAVMLCLDATFRLAGPQGRRSVKARAFYLGTYETALQPGEILTHVEVPVPPAGQGQAYEKLKRKIGDYATAAAAVTLSQAGGRVTACTIALTNLAPTAILADAAAAAVVGKALDAATLKAAATAAQAAMEPSSDGRGTAAYRRHAGGVMVARALQQAFQRARG